jgi:hypothetical protein
MRPEPVDSFDRRRALPQSGRKPPRKGAYAGRVPVSSGGSGGPVTHRARRFSSWCTTRRSPPHERRRFAAHGGIEHSHDVRLPALGRGVREPVAIGCARTPGLHRDGPAERAEPLAQPEEPRVVPHEIQRHGFFAQEQQVQWPRAAHLVREADPVSGPGEAGLGNVAHRPTV